VKSLNGALRIIRPLNGLIALISLAVAVYLASGEVRIQITYFLALFFIVSFGYAINDVFDLESDRKTKPSRPMPAGKLSRRGARFTALTFLVLGLISTIIAAPAVKVYFLLLAVCLFLYAWRLSRILIVSNITVAILCSSVFLLGGLMAAGSPDSWMLLGVAILFSFLHHLGREMVKDLQDAEGDRLIGRRTLPLVVGVEVSRWIAALVLLLLVATTYIAYALLHFSTMFLIIVTLGVNLPLLLLLMDLLRKSPNLQLWKASLLIKVTMLPGLAALLLAYGV
jgi:geranylgeranylglycerol-phosphate geranylgeranyltransferase